MEEGVSVTLQLSADDAAALREADLGRPAIRTRGVETAIPLAFDAISVTASMVTLAVGARELRRVFELLFRRKPHAAVDYPLPRSDEELRILVDGLRQLAEQARADANATEANPDRS